ncbi:uncharacterized protein LOC110445035, partial [Mizuhopecten yessoensis]|uniref:uncharacterized protein LOC110445035 n=1 Tax=Mizuhopecten yessoensis TaxID=6573 RepID=UPI000B45D64C
SIGSGSEEIQEEEQNIDSRSEKWRKLLFQKNCPVQFENEPHWYKVLQRYRPSRSLYDGLGANTPGRVVKLMNPSKQTSLSSENATYWAWSRSKRKKRGAEYGKCAAVVDSRK